jgi:HPt (histidine-containing phosphotransfer) domain-containing protein
MATDILEQIRIAFKAEALDLLIELDSSLLALEAEPGDMTMVHRVFRAIHTLKGSGGMAGFKHLAQFTHKLEEAFDLARERKLTVSPELVDCALKACDVIRVLIEDTEEAVVPGEEEVILALTQLLSGSSDIVQTVHVDLPKSGAVVRAAFEITLKPNRKIFYSGSDPVTLLDELKELGQAHITAHIDEVPAFASLDPEQCYLWWQILLVTNCDTDRINEVFVFVEDECELHIQLLEDQSGAVALLGSVPAETLQLFTSECEDHLERIEIDALSLEKDPDSRDRLDSVFRSVHSIKGNAGVLLGQISATSLLANHPLPLLHRMAHGLESLSIPFVELERDGCPTRPFKLPWRRAMLSACW